jgi:hypothetical protein
MIAVSDANARFLKWAGWRSGDVRALRLEKVTALKRGIVDGNLRRSERAPNKPEK